MLFSARGRPSQKGRGKSLCGKAYSVVSLLATSWGAVALPSTVHRLCLLGSSIGSRYWHGAEPPGARGPGPAPRPVCCSLAIWIGQAISSLGRCSKGLPAPNCGNRLLCRGPDFWLDLGRLYAVSWCALAPQSDLNAAKECPTRLWEIVGFWHPTRQEPAPLANVQYPLHRQCQLLLRGRLYYTRMSCVSQESIHALIGAKQKVHYS